jgi:hypothetical protein
MQVDVHDAVAEVTVVEPNLALRQRSVMAI